MRVACTVIPSGPSEKVTRGTRYLRIDSKTKTSSTFIMTTFCESQGVGRLCLTRHPTKRGRLEELRDEEPGSGDTLCPPPAPSFCYHPASHLQSMRKGRPDEF